MKVLLLTPSVRPLGARRSLVELVRFLPREVTPLVICPSMSGIALELKDLGVDIEVAPQGAWRKLGGRIKSYLFQLPGIRRTIARFRPDVCHANEFHIIPQLYHSNSGKLGISGHIRLGITSRQVNTYLLNRCDRIVTVSEAVAGLLKGTGLEERVRVVHNGVDLKGFQTIQKAGETGGTWEDTLRVGIFGLVSERKAQLLAAEAVALVAKRGVSVKLVVAGDAFGSSVSYGDKLRARIAEPDLAGRVTWLPFQSDVAPLYRSIDLNLLISTEEGFGRTIIEAGALGVPSVGTRIGGIPEIIQEGRTGWLIDQGDVVGLAAAIEEAATNREERLKRGAAARIRTQAHFTIQAHVGHMLSVWNEVKEIGERRRAAT